MSQETKRKRKRDNNASVLKVIFLDIDGVLLPFPQKGPPKGTLFPTNTIKALDRLLKATQASLVLSSTWRALDRFVQDILDDFQKHGLGVTAFHDMTDKHYHAERQWEIHRWLSQNEGVNKLYWLVLDDEELIKGEENEKLASTFQGHVVKPISSVGLTEEDVDRGIQLWQEQLASK
ncbi:unnamed protein product [Cylindrotheca closterium]|uniref:Uncharacterized protein n=1 Tax=Cylindrotheca closterium TaxID=2856 RepID=A0AAD2FXR9_9STRA|nr:unnamed protein product [Cylindrotheca closterium]